MTDAGGSPISERPADATTERDAPLDATAEADVDGSPAPIADGVCSPKVTKSGVLDPDCVYVLGSLAGVSGAVVLFLPPFPYDRLFGFGNPEERTMFVHPKDGRLYFYANAGPDKALYRFTSNAEVGGTESDQLAVQTIIPTPACAPPFWFDGLFVFPDDGEILYRCYVSTSLFRAGTSTPYPTFGYEVSAVGVHRTLLAYRSSEGPQNI
ncbi:MAG: hypothetical protein JST00_12595 [Deltaproteobacteria bacterium]|nr:hypothetical protein [Deltaproteobacteria bacterium]